MQLFGHHNHLIRSCSLIELKTRRYLKIIFIFLSSSHARTMFGSIDTIRFLLRHVSYERFLFYFVLLLFFSFLFLGGIQTSSSVGSHDKRFVSNYSHDLMARSSGTNISEEYDSDFDDSSSEDEEPSTQTGSPYENNEEQRKKFLLEVKISSFCK